MISKELLSEMLSAGKYPIHEITEKNHIITYSVIMETYDDIISHLSTNTINIYELAYKCRMWARNKGYQITAMQPVVPDDTGAQVINYWFKSYITKIDIGSYDPPYQILSFDCNVESEPEAIFRACEWVYKEVIKDYFKDSEDGK